MVRKAFFLILIFPLIALAGKLDRIKRAIDNSDYVKAQELIDKAYEKEPFNPGISYFQAFLYQTSTFQRYHLDSARTVIAKAITDFEAADEKIIADLKEDGIDLTLAISLQTKIRDKQFQHLLSEVSMERVTDFRSKYPNSVYDEVLEYKRDSIVFLNVKEAKSQNKLSQFIANYPTSIFVPDAKILLDQLRYAELKKTGKLQDYYTFLVQHPRTSFRSPIENYIFKYSTLDHSAESYADFIGLASDKHLVKKASDLLYYIQKEKTILTHPFEDSIQHIFNASELDLFAVIDRNQYGFVNEKGKVQIDYKYDQIQEASKCTVNEDDWIFVKKGETGFIINKLGDVVLSDVDNYVSLTDGAAMVYKHQLTYLYHKSGFKILEEPIEDAEVLEERWIKVKRNGKSHLVSFLGIPVTETKYDDIYLEGSFWIFKKRGKLAVYTEKLIANELHQKGLSLEFKFEDIELVGTNKFIGFIDDRECLIDEQLNFLIPWGNYIIHPSESGWYLKSEEGYQLYNSLDEDVLDRKFPYLESNNGWLALKTQEDWMLLPRKEGLLPSRGYDSLKLINDFIALTLKDDQAEVIFNDGSLLKLQQNEVLKTFTNTHFISVRNQSDIAVYNENGQSLVSGKFEKISFLNDTLLIVEKNKKQGLINTKGEFLLRPVFDLLDQQKGMVFLLLEGKIGCYDLQKNVVFMPKYEARFEKIGEDYLTKLDGKYGLINLEEQPILDFKYDEIHFWNDSIFRVKESSYFDFINHAGESSINGIELMSKMVTTARHEIWKFVKGGKYGLISTQKGMLLQPEFTDIFDIGTSENSLFFADQHLDKAGFHVVSYINEKGELVLSKAYTKEEFDLILCED